MKKFRILLIMAVAFIASGITASAQTMDELKTAVELLNAECPQDLGDNMVMQSMKIVGNDIIATVMTEVDDSVIQIIELMGDQMVPTFIEQFHADEDMNAFLMLCKSNHVNFKMVFTNAKGTKATLLFPYKDM